MAKLILEVPQSKIQTILNVLLPLGIKTNAIMKAGTKKNTDDIKKRLPRFLLNWEFFSNELEYE